MNGKRYFFSNNYPRKYSANYFRRVAIFDLKLALSMSYIGLSFRQRKGTHMVPSFRFIIKFSFLVSDKTDEDDSASATYQAVSELPQANRDTLAFLVVHLQK